MTLSGGTPPNGTSSGSSHLTRSSGSEADVELQARMDLKRKRRMESNRRSAKVSRLRKQKHLDDLNSQVNQLTRENQQLITALNITAQSYAAAEAQNLVMRTQLMELESRLCALREIFCNMNSNTFANATTTTYPSTMMTATTPNYDVLSETAWIPGMQMMQQPIDLLYQC